MIPPPPRIKFCGITRPQCARAAAAAGASAVGFVFYPPAKTAVTPQTARACADALPAFVSSVALFVNMPAGEARQILDELRPDYAQFHGDETAEYCLQFGIKYIKAVRVQGAQCVGRAQRAHPQARAILADSYAPNTPGGSGKTFDWSLLPPTSAEDMLPPVIVAGGLTPANVGGLVSRFCPYGVDVSGGIAEDDNRRIKNWDKMQSFVWATQNAKAS